MPTKSPLAAKAEALAAHTEIVEASWSRARSLLEGIKTLARLSIAGRIVLGRELHDLKHALGFAGRGGDRRSNGHAARLKNGERGTWADWCQQELGISRDTADRLVRTYEAAKARLQTIGGETRLLSLLDKPAGTLSTPERQDLAKLVDRLEWPETQGELLQELHIYKRHTAPPGGDTSAHRGGGDEPPTARQLAFAFFGGIPAGLGKLSKAVSGIRVCKDYQALLHALPPVPEEDGQPSLTTLVEEIEAAERDLAALKADAAKALEQARSL